MSCYRVWLATFLYYHSLFTTIVCHRLPFAAERSGCSAGALKVLFAMSHRQPYSNDIPQYVGESGDVAELPDGEEDEAMEEVVDEQGYGEYSSCDLLK